MISTGRLKTLRRAPLAVAFVLVLASALLALVNVDRAQGAGAERCARFAADSAARERILTGSGPRIVVLGDSYSVGLGLPDARRSWPSRLPGQTRVLGFSGSGFADASSPCHHVSYADRVGRAAPGTGLVVVEGGLNDVDQPTASVRAGVRAVLAALRGHQVLVVGPVAAPTRADRVQRINRILAAECARAGVRYLSMTQLQLPYLTDGLHLTAAGHRAFGDTVAQAIAAR